MKCPACGFETPDSQAWCDFCKEPFKKPTPKAPAAAASAPAAAAPVDPAPAAPAEAPASPGPAKAAPAAVPLDPAAVKGMSNEKIMELLKMDAAQDSIPATAPATRYVAWAFLAAVFLMLMVLSAVALRKFQRGALSLPRQETAVAAPETPPVTPAPAPPETPAAAPPEASPETPTQNL
jgi:hypothetical protein